MTGKWKIPSHMGLLILKKLLKVSSNIYFARKVFDTYSGKAQKFIDDLNELGITKPLGNKIKGGR